MKNGDAGIFPVYYSLKIVILPVATKALLHSPGSHLRIVVAIQVQRIYTS